jgi:hypothetical protein
MQNDLQEKSEEACARMNEMVQELFGGREPGEDGDGDGWFVAAIHTPDMPSGGVMSFASLPYAEAIGAATMLAMVFTRKHEERQMSFVVRGFSDVDARRLSMVEAYSRHYEAGTKVANVIELVAQFDAAEFDTRDEIRAQIEALLEEIQADADADLEAKLTASAAEHEVEIGLAMSDAANWGHNPNE